MISPFLSRLSVLLRASAKSGGGCLLLASLLVVPGCAADPSTPTVSVPLWGDAPHKRPACVRGIHLTSWYTGTKKGRANIESLLAETELNTAVIDIKEIEGEVYIPGVKLDGAVDVYVRAFSGMEDYVRFLKDRGVYTVARIVVFKDNKLAKERPDWAVRSSTPIPKAAEMEYRSDVWVDRKGFAWADPYQSRVWDYNIAIAQKAVEIGFQEIQFDYIRFPSDGNTNLCRYSKPHSAEAAVNAIAGFLKRARERLNPMGAVISIDTFGMTGSTGDDLGIGQKVSRLVPHIDVISPMMYPSHYAKGEYGLKDPNASPYETVFRSIEDTKKILSETTVELRPYFQDFSLFGVSYGAEEVRAQIRAANENGVYEWLLWNPVCRYTREALAPNTPAELPAE